jgi:hypothetical protein
VALPGGFDSLVGGQSPIVGTAILSVIFLVLIFLLMKFSSQSGYSKEYYMQNPHGIKNLH